MSTSRPTGNVEFDNTGRVVVTSGAAALVGQLQSGREPSQGRGL